MSLRKRESKRKVLFLLFFIIASASVGCMLKVPHTIIPDYQDKSPTSIAVLPVQNETVDMDAPNVFRSKLLSKVISKGYVSPSSAQIDDKLGEKGIREAGQLGSMTSQELGEFLNVDALLYSTVTEWSTTYLVVYSSIKVGAKFQLIDVKTGKQLWESEHEVSKKKFGTDKESIGNSLAFAALQRYDPYVDNVIEKTFLTLPNGPHFVPSKRGGCL